MKKLILFLSLVSILCSCTQEQPSQDYFIGTNFWYAGRLAQSADGLQRLDAELDRLHELGLDNLRVLATEGEDLDALEVALDKMDQRGMKAVLFLNNAWQWSYGFPDYLERAGLGPQPRPETHGYGVYMHDMCAFCQSKDAIAINHEYVRSIVTRFKDHPAIYSWQISNEPRAFSEKWEVKQAFVEYIHNTARLIKSIDPDTMVSTGNEGRMGCEGDLDLVRRINDCEAVDYMTIHIWPYNWSWAKADALAEGVENAVQKTEQYIDEHITIARNLGKKMVIEEFGYPRDGFSFSKESTTSGRDAIYACVFNKVVQSSLTGDALLGCNFWGWGGYATPLHEWWQEGDPYCGDPAQEQQGLNSVFNSDESTVGVISTAVNALEHRIAIPMQHDWVFEGKAKTLTVNTFGNPQECADITVALITDRSQMLEKKDTALVLKGSAAAGKDIKLDLSALAPGFYQLCATYSVGSTEGCIKPFNIAIDPQQVISATDVPADEFKAFWDGALAELAAVPAETEMTVWPEYSNELRTTYKVRFNSIGGGIGGGVLCVPNAEGKYPVYMEYMGYGADVYPYDPSSNPDRIQFLVSIRNQGIFRDEAQRWIDRGLQDKNIYYYRGAYCDAVRAIDVAYSLDKADTDHVFASGESQGGALTIVAAALDHRITAAAPAVPFMGDFADYWKIVWWPEWEVFEAAEREGISRESVLELMRWFDTKNFAPMVQCPVYMAFGLQDPVCPPHTNWAPYNNMSCPKQWFCSPRCGHGMWEIALWKQVRQEFFDTFME